MVDLAKQYADLIKEVDEIEKDSLKVESNTIDIFVLSSTQQEHSKSSFSVLLDSAMKIESSIGITSKETSKPEQHIARQYSPIQSLSKVQQSGTMVLHNIGRPSPAEGVKSEIGEFANSLQVESPAVESFKLNPEKDKQLVLVKLSVPDQITELEKIIEGLREQVFDKDHIEIIKKEAYGLNDEATKQRKAADKAHQSMEQRLLSVRDQRLNDVLAMLRDMNV